MKLVLDCTCEPDQITPEKRGSLHDLVIGVKDVTLIKRYA
jgi:hypothetical protein